LKQKIRNFYEVGLGILFILTIYMGYCTIFFNDFSEVKHLAEYCFISGMSVGVIFLFSPFYYRIKGRRMPDWLYFNCMISILIILIATFAVQLNLEGVFWFIHLINPVALFLYWIVFCDHNSITKPSIIATVVVFPICYIAFSYILLRITGYCAFPANLILVGNSYLIQIAIIAGLCTCFLGLGHLLHFLNRYIHKNSTVGKKSGDEFCEENIE